mgnify:CR=1 FL=1
MDYGDINSREIRLFMQDKHEMAYSYLLTIGAKALILSEESNVTSNTLKDGMTTESKSNRQIRRDEVARLQQTKLRNGVGIIVTKRGRNNESTRKILLKIKAFPGSEDEFLVWKSHWTGIRNKFALKELVEAKLLGESRDVVDISSHTTVNANSKPPFLRLTGNTRFVDLQFNNMLETDTFMTFCKGAIAKNSGRSSAAAGGLSPV